ncbi:MAG: DUF4150 domain-containing protein [Mesorhizobium sp.]|nr:DUF4150 domain-containing protein [Mesorhizobium sp. M1A.T.Ca.IN.004.03.1.1]RWG14864.1 MAG: DUF4150 domain-containing protein [Mesorhizobium sp.]RWI99445.1 MAG: DUF4150 domain-containing protein [Mesorhizobium sp.]RWK40195.1 MAG: DUF4150 domain-containing protein [Mesorhizobium sp.]RWK90662.1 MAG: DUF4150 domain-containing protein [Mesorhizobium sp.]
MGNTVYAEKMGFFHQASGGKGIAPGDVCLSPPPPPAGPVPVPYVNMLSASDLIKGSKSVKVQGTPTALENSSEVALSTGNEAATPGLGAGVITHRIKGKGSFKLWSFTVKVEGKGVCRHGDPMEQNTASPLPNTVDVSAMVDFSVVLGKDAMKEDCPRDYKYSEDYTPTTETQRASVQGQACWQCKKDRANILRRTPGPAKDKALKAIDAKIKKQTDGKVTMIADHQPPQKVAWEMGACHDADSFAQRMRDLPCQPHCHAHSMQQSRDMRELDRRELYDTMNANIRGLNI